MQKVSYILLVFIFLATACREEEIIDKPCDDNQSLTPYVFDLPPHFELIGAPFIPEDNPMTEEGVALGKKLFFEVKLSSNEQFSCASCHDPSQAFNDKGNAFSLGVRGLPGVRNAMPLFNLAWIPKQGSAFNWNGSAESLEKQAFNPVTDPVEMNAEWPKVEEKLQNDPLYPPLFKRVFGTDQIDSTLVTKAISQFTRTLISGGSRLDNFIIEQYTNKAVDGPTLTNQELRGFNVYITEGKGDCFHCHGELTNPLFTDNTFKNNGLDQQPDSGLAGVTGNPNDVGKFKVPSLRNLVFTPPYMHDGRFSTIREVVDFYADNVQMNSPNIDAVMQKPRIMSNAEREDLVAFLKAITDSSFVNNPKHRQ